jgi:hypothetical protein
MAQTQELTEGQRKVIGRIFESRGIKRGTRSTEDYGRCLAALPWPVSVGPHFPYEQALRFAAEYVGV